MTDKILLNIRRIARVTLALGLASGILLSALSPAVAQPASVYAFFGRQGCAIGPATLAAAREAGYEPKLLDVVTETARAHKDTVKSGGWLVLPPQLCTITMREPANKLRLTDMEVQNAFSAPDAYAAQGDPGCFLNSEKLFEELRHTRHWDNNTINREYIRLIGASLISGEVTFYSSSPVRTPAGFQLVTGRCADVPLIGEIRKNHTFLVEFFDPLIRANAAHVKCERGASPLTVEIRDIIRKLSGQENMNAWLGFEIRMIAMGAGWYEGMSYTDKGTPRPPLCH